MITDATNWLHSHEKLVQRIACQPAVGKTLNKIRELAGRPPLQMPTKSQDSPQP